MSTQYEQKCGYCQRCGEQKDVYTNICTQCLAKQRVNNWKHRGHDELAIEARKDEGWQTS